MTPRIRSVLRHCWRGTGTLPVVGEHPGDFALWLFLVSGFIAGTVRHDFLGGLFGLIVSALVFGPLYLWGAYERSLLSERIMENSKWAKH